MVRLLNPKFVGRAAELTTLDRALDAASGGNTTAVLVGGEAGVGKSRLLHAWNEHARERGARVIVGTCPDLGANGPGYTAIVAAMRELIAGFGDASVNDLLGADRSTLSRLIPELGPNALGQEWTQLAQARFFERLVDVLERATLEGSVVLELEDIHWADPSTQAFIVYLMAVSKTARLLVIGTYRTEDPGLNSGFRPFVEQISRLGTTILTLRPFDHDETREQVAGLIGHGPSTAFLDAIVRRSEGNALFAEELVAAGHSGGGLPSSVAEALATRTASMSRAAMDVLRTASVAGRTVSYEVLRASTSLEDIDLAAALRQIVETSVMEPIHTPESYRFRHALFQEAIYRDVLPGERRRLHANVATVLDAGVDPTIDPAERAAMLAIHWYQGGNSARALDASIVAGGLASERSAHAEATRHFGRAIELWSRVHRDSDRRDKARLQQRATRQAILAGEFSMAVEFGQPALESLAYDAEPGLTIQLLHDLTVAMESLAREDEAAAYQERLAEIDEAALPARERILVLDARSLVAVLEQADYPRALAAARAMLAAANAEADDRLQAMAHSTLANCLLAMQDYDAAIAHARAARDHALRAGDTEAVAEAHRLTYVSLWEVGNFDAAVTEARAAKEYGARVGLAGSVGPAAATFEAESLRALGQLAASDETIDAALRDDPTGRNRLHLHTLAAEVALARGRLNEAGDHLRQAASPDITYPRGYFATVMTSFAVAEGRFADAGDIAVDTARQIAEIRPYTPHQEDLPWLVEAGVAAQAERAEIARAAGDNTSLIEAIESTRILIGCLDAVTALRQASGVRDSGRHRGREQLIEGHLGRVEDRDSPTRWIAAAEAFPSGSVEALTARWRQAQAMLADRAPRDEVAVVLVRAHLTAVENGAVAIAARLEELARRARIDLQPPVSASGSAAMGNAADVEPAEPRNAGYEALRSRRLSGREIEVLTLVAAGLSNREIGERLFISSKTASVHVSHILDKLGVSTRIEAAMIGVRLGLPEVEPNHSQV